MLWLVSAAAALGLVTFVMWRRRSVLITVQGNSMAPTFAHGDRLLVRRANECQVGDVVVFRTPVEADGAPSFLVKRVVAVAGDPVPEQVTEAVPQSAVPSGQFVVRGDNWQSLDSRSFGCVPAETMLGVVVRVMTKVG